MKLFACILGVLIPAISIAVVQQTSIVTRPGVVTTPIKYYFDLSSALSEGVNQSVKVTVSASNAEKTAVRFESVQLFGKDGGVLGSNVASKTDALSATPYAFVFQNFGVSSADLVRVAGVQLTFLDLGGENPTGKVTVQGVIVSVDRSVGRACIIADPSLVPLVPPPTIVAIQTYRPLEPRGGGATSGVATSQGPYGSSDLSTPLLSGAWLAPEEAGASDNVYANYGPGTGVTQPLRARLFGFSVPITATINGIVFQVEMKSSVSNSIRDDAARIVKAGSQVGTNYARASSVKWPTSDTVITYGGSSDLWGTTWTGSEINQTTFGFDISAVLEITTMAEIDYISATVYYTPVGSSIYDSFMDLLRTLFRRAK